MNEVASAGQVWVCTACGKRSQDKYGDKSLSKWWDVSCVLNSVLCYEDKLVLKDGVVTRILEGGFVSEKSSAQ